MAWPQLKRFLIPLQIAVICIIIGSLVTILALKHNKSSGSSYFPVSASLRKQILFPLFIPTKEVRVDTASYKLEPQQKILTFTGQLPDGQVVTFSEQATPEPILDVPNFYQEFLQTLHEYQAVDGLQGTIYFTHPNGAGQVAVMNAKGTLIFARVSHDEPENVWLPLFNSMVVYVP